MCGKTICVESNGLQAVEASQTFMLTKIRINKKAKTEKIQDMFKILKILDETLRILNSIS